MLNSFALLCFHFYDDHADPENEVNADCKLCDRINQCEYNKKVFKILTSKRSSENLQ